MGLSPGLESEKALRIDNRSKEMEISDYLNGLDKTDKLLIRDICYLYCGGVESKEEKTISKILEEKIIRRAKNKLIARKFIRKIW